MEYKREEDKNRVYMTYKEMVELFERINQHTLPAVKGYVIFSEKSFDREYPEVSRTYEVSSANKAWRSDMNGSSVFGSCLDGTDPCVRIDKYIREGLWIPEKCYIIRDKLPQFDNKGAVKE